MRSPTVSSLTWRKVGHEVSVSLLLDLLIIAVGVEEKSEDFADSESQWKLGDWTPSSTWEEWTPPSTFNSRRTSSAAKIGKWYTKRPTLFFPFSFSFTSTPLIMDTCDMWEKLLLEKKASLLSSWCPEKILVRKAGTHRLQHLSISWWSLTRKAVSHAIVLYFELIVSPKWWSLIRVQVVCK